MADHATPHTLPPDYDSRSPSLRNDSILSTPQPLSSTSPPLPASASLQPSTHTKSISRGSDDALPQSSKAAPLVVADSSSASADSAPMTMFASSPSTKTSIAPPSLDSFFGNLPSVENISALTTMTKRNFDAEAGCPALPVPFEIGKEEAEETRSQMDDECLQPASHDINDDGSKDSASSFRSRTRHRRTETVYTYDSFRTRMTMYRLLMLCGMFLFLVSLAYFVVGVWFTFYYTQDNSQSSNVMATRRPLPIEICC